MLFITTFLEQRIKTPYIPFSIKTLFLKLWFKPISNRSRSFQYFSFNMLDQGSPNVLAKGQHPVSGTVPRARKQILI